MSTTAWTCRHCDTINYAVTDPGRCRECHRSRTALGGLLTVVAIILAAILAVIAFTIWSHWTRSSDCVEFNLTPPYQCADHR